MKRDDILDRQQEIVQWIALQMPKSFIAKELCCDVDTLNRYLILMGIEYSGNRAYVVNKSTKKPMTQEKYLKTSKDIQSNKIRKKLLAEGYKEYRCERCGNTKWLDKPIPQELHHKDGDKKNNAMENFELLCPNCHAFTDSYKGKNIKR